MALSYDLISQFAKQVAKTDKKTSSESTVYGTVMVDRNGNKYVKLDGSDQLTPLTEDERPSVDSASANANDGERVSVLIKNHTAVVTGNISSPAARTGDVEDLEDQVSEIQEFDILIGQQVQANEAYIQQLQTDKANVGELNAALAEIAELEAQKASIEQLNAAKAEIDDILANKIDADVVDAQYARIDSLQAIEADIEHLETTRLTAIDASIEDLYATKLSADQVDLRYANIDFSNIGEAAIDTFYAKSGIIQKVTISEGVVVKELVGVTIKGDLIEGGTVKADKLVVKGSDGLYYKLNFEGGTFADGEVVPDDSLHGSVITAKSITAEKVSVQDLVAFDATIGGFKITENSIYSGAKASADNTSTGVYLDDEGQMAFGDSINFVKYYKDTDGTYKLEISAGSIILSATNKTIEETITDATDDVRADITEQNTSIISTCNEIILTALDSYVETSDYDAFKSTVETQLTVMAGEIAMNFATTTERIEDVDGDLQSEVSKWNKYITFTDEGITISAGKNAMSIRIDNDVIVFEKDGAIYGWWDGIDFHTGNIVVDVNERAQFGNFAYVPRSDGSLSFLKVRHNTGFYGSLKYGMLSLYGTYPIVEDTTMVFSDISGELNGTTLILGG